MLDADGCRRRFDLVYGGSLTFQPAFLAPTPPRAIVARMLANLERGQLGTDPVQRAWMCELHLSIPGLAFHDQLALADHAALLITLGEDLEKSYRSILLQQHHTTYQLTF